MINEPESYQKKAKLKDNELPVRTVDELYTLVLDQPANN